MSKILLIRHGHVEGIKPERFRGRAPLELTEQGREQFRAFVRELWRWLVTEVELANGEPLDEQGREDLQVVARSQMLSDDPVTEPIELAQAGA